ncbi:hypothetical protein CUJ86_10645, partial [Methanofollis fontis]
MQVEQLYSGGSGTSDDPYQISTRDDVIYLSTDSENWDKHFIVTTDISLADGSPTATIGNSGTKFTGNFDGQGHTISDFTLSKTGVENVGLFGYVGSGAEIKDLGITAGDAGVTGKCYVGVLAGSNTGSITNCSATGNANASDYAAGGFVGYSEGTITNCYATGNATTGTANLAGGLVGYNNGGTITNCYAIGNANAEVRFAGGLVGYNNGGTITNCYATGNATVGTSLTGGLVGSNTGTITNCYRHYNGGDNSWGTYVPDLMTLRDIAFLTGDELNNGLKWSASIISTEADSTKVWRAFTYKSQYPIFQWQSFGTGTIQVNSTPAGANISLNGVATGSETNATLSAIPAGTYNVSATKSGYDTGYQSITLTGDATASVNFTLVQQVGTLQVNSTPAGALISINGSSTGNYTNATFSNYLPGTYNVTVELDGYIPSPGFRTVTLATGETETAAFTLVQMYSGGNGTAANPYQISTRDDVIYLSTDSENWDKHFIVTTDISLADGSPTATIGNSSTKFTGNFDGQGHTISEFTIFNWFGSYIGFFGYVDSGAEISNLRITAGDAGVSGSNNVGVLAGYNTGTLTNCYATGNATAFGDYAGGLVGESHGPLTNCSATGSATANEYAGGLVGESDGTLTNCYATGDATATESWAGGLVGYFNSGTITNCSATGDATVTASWAGGLVGSCGSSSITNCSATGDVTAGDEYAGGLVGQSYGSITNCYATGNASAGYDCAGGLAGSIRSDGSITNCYATGNATARNDYAGGLVAENMGAITNSYATGSATAGGSNTGGLVGYVFSGTLTNCYRHYNSGGCFNGTYVSDLTTFRDIDFLTGTTPNDGLGWSTGNISTSADLTKVWRAFTSKGQYPIFQWQSYGTGIIRVNSTPDGADISLNGVATGSETNATLSSIPAGTYNVSAAKSGYDTGYQSITLAGDETASVNFTLVQQVGTLQVNSTPAGALISINGSSTGNYTNATFSNYLPGTYNVTVELDGYISSPRFRNVTIFSGETETAAFTLVPLYSGGNGTAANPYQISTRNDVIYLSNDSVNWDKHFIVTANISLSEGGPTETIGNSGTRFTGNFDGQGHTISDFTLNKSGVDYVGLFGWVGSGAEVKNLGITAGDAGVTGKCYVGVLAGYSKGSLTNCYATGSVTASDYLAGGLVGYNSGGSITNCYATGNATTGTGNLAGGLVGNNVEGTITNCYATGNADAGSRFAGGLVGLLQSGTITNCYATGNATAGNEYAGGLVGENWGTITNCYRHYNGSDSLDGTYVSDLTTFRDIAFLTGTTPNDGLKWSTDIISTDADSSKIWRAFTSKSLYPIFQWQSFGTGTIRVNSTPDGADISLNGVATGSETNATLSSIPAGTYNVSAAKSGYDTGYQSITLAGDETASVNFTLVQQVGTLQVNSTPAGALISINGSSTGNYTNATFSNYLPGTYNVTVELDGYISSPRFRNVTILSGETETAAFTLVPLYSGGNGTAANPYQISTREDVIYLSNDSVNWDKHFIVTNDISLAEGSPAETIGNSGTTFTGNVDGQGHTISDFTIAKTGVDNVGFFGYLSTGAEIRNLRVTAGDAGVSGQTSVGVLAGRNNYGNITNCSAAGTATASASNAGVLAGYTIGPITNCSATGSANAGAHNAGGLVGYGYEVAIGNCSATGTATAGGSNAGGLVGYSKGATSTTTNCYATGNADAVTNYAGGLIGNSEGTITNCSATGTATASGFAGGLVGYSKGTTKTITKCSATGNVTADGDYAGGLVGWNGGTITNCYAAGTATAGTNYAGGLVGYSYGSITNCYATGTATADGDYAGGLVGWLYLFISNSYATGTATASTSAGGLVGEYHEYGGTSNCYRHYDGGDCREGTYVSDLTKFRDIAFLTGTAPNDGLKWSTDIISTGDDSSKVWRAFTYKGQYPIFQWQSFGTGTIQVNSTPDGANISLNGVATGSETNATLSSIPAGTYNVSATKSGYDTGYQSITLASDATASVNFSLIAQVGTLQVNSTPAGAAIYLDGVLNASVTNATLSALGTGTYNVTVVLDDYETAVNDSVTVSYNETTQVSFDLVHQTGGLQINSSPAGAGIYLDGVLNASVTNATLSNLDTGTYNVTLVLEDYETAVNESVTVSNNVTTLVTFDLVRQTGGLQINSSPAGAAIYLNGTASGVTNATLGDLDTGTYNVTLVLEDYETAVNNSVTVSNNETTPVTFDLVHQTGDLRINSTPAGATIYLNGTVSGVTNTTLSDINTGTYNITVARTNLAPLSRTVTLSSNETEDVLFEFSRYSGGNGTAASPYRITSSADIEELVSVPEDWAGKHFVVDNDITLTSGQPSAPIGNITVPFTGTFGGQGHTISNFTLNKTGVDHGGLFGYVGTGAEIKNLGITAGDAGVTGNSWVGVLAGYNNGGTITNCSATGNATTDKGIAGGLVGGSTGTITNCYATGNATGKNGAGGLVGGSTGTITNCSATGNADAETDYAGGLAGYNNGTITNCSATGNATADESCAGGLAGYNNGGTITNCSATGNADAGTDNAGGLVGHSDISGTITNCYATGNATARDMFAGGLAGSIFGGNALNCYATGNADAGTDFAGGLAGYNRGTITNCYATGNTTSAIGAGGLVGGSDGAIKNCYATGAGNAQSHAGGLIGGSAGTITNCYRHYNGGDCLDGTYVSDPTKFRDIDFLTGDTPDDGLNWSTGNISTSADSTKIWRAYTYKSQYPIFQWQSFGTGTIAVASAPAGASVSLNGVATGSQTNATLSDMPAGTYTVTAERDGHITTPASLEITLGAGETETAAFTLVQLYSGGNGTAANPYQISTRDDVIYLSTDSANWDKHFIVTNDISLSEGSPTETIGNGSSSDYYFTGTFDGRGHTISEFTIDKSGFNSIGLFGYLGSGAEITNLSVATGTGGVQGKANVGILAGASEGSMINCSATGSVSGSEAVGGLVGVTDGTITYCYATCTATAENGAGGLVGGMAVGGSITNSYATGTATAGTYYAGGLVSLMEGGTVTNSYATGNATAGACYAGGLVGIMADGTLTNCYATGAGNALYQSGGLIGLNEDGTVTNCYRHYNGGDCFNGTYVSDPTKFRDIDFLTGDTPDDGLNWSTGNISTSADSTKIWRAFTYKGQYPIFQWQSYSTGTIAVTSAPAGASVTLNGVDSAEVTNATFPDMPEGLYNVTVVLDGYETGVNESVAVTGNETTSVFFDLVRRTGGLQINSTPSGASIYLDGVLNASVTNATLSALGTGTYNVTVVLEDYETAVNESVTVSYNETTQVSFDLVHQTGGLQINSTPAGASIYLDGVLNASVTNATLSNLDTGTYNVTLVLDDYETAVNDSVTVSNNATTLVTFDLVRQTGGLQINSSPAGAAIYLDGVLNASVTNATLSDLDTGIYNVTVAMSGYDSETQNVTVSSNQTETVSFTLVQQLGTLQINSTPSGAAVYLNGTATGDLTNATLADKPVGTYNVTVELDGYDPATEVVTLSKDETEEVSFTLVQQL